MVNINNITAAFANLKISDLIIVQFNALMDEKLNQSFGLFFASCASNIQAASATFAAFASSAFISSSKASSAKAKELDIRVTLDKADKRVATGCMRYWRKHWELASLSSKFGGFSCVSQDETACLSAWLSAWLSALLSAYWPSNEAFNGADFEALGIDWAWETSGDDTRLAILISRAFSIIPSNHKGMAFSSFWWADDCYDIESGMASLGFR